jgi:hypothetical protein
MLWETAGVTPNTIPTTNPATATAAAIHRLRNRLLGGT